MFKINNLSFFLNFISLLITLIISNPSEALDIKAREYILVDFQTWTVLAEKNADEPMPPSSMSKLMTAYMLFEAIHSGAISLDDYFVVSENAWRKGGAASGGSTMFLEPNSRVRVEDLLRGIIIQSGNDACIVVAEEMAGTEDTFAVQMSERALEIGLKGSNFTNSTGLPNPEHYMTARDLATLARRIIKDFPEYYSLYSEREFTYNDIKQYNRNPLLSIPGKADGLKTGRTSIAGYGLTASAMRDGRRLILVANGMQSPKIRSSETSKLMDWGFRNFTNKNLFRAGEIITNADVWLGETQEVPLVLEDDISITIPRQAWRTLQVKVVYSGPVASPIIKGQKIGKLVIDGDRMSPLEYDLFASESVGKLGFIKRIKAAANHILFGYSDD
ncbi:MAG: D-alanyl-D-alanine carboxypeptidase [Alphaproteobacteria bacterium TMED87]|mgnify:CR=1 FL=1|nr:D-alanyl-D-alanine carboxypeptidase [Rhodospirillaceae bacterium]OUV09946.1 MAG: D-alanyl-D-alanine carboxypeptidase [Alphaproteobacteria bacterium TMED87]|tara:strand:- start:256 stop:1422 length:1167 start_codon:yes stop_codon:yes gene_type:complete